MTDAQALCGYKPKPPDMEDMDYQCRHPVRQAGVCLFHLSKPTEKQKQAMAPEARAAAEEIEEEFRQSFLKLLEDEEKNPETEVFDFRYFCFPAIDLPQRQFPKPLDLTGATFSGWAGFALATFDGNADFKKATFSRGAHFWGATFKKEAFFDHATFNDVADFREAKFNEKADFGGATFNEKAFFERATFSENASFWLTTFNGRANFGGATFSEGASFGEATFSEKADFKEATFSERADFDEATFRGKASFGEKTFKDKCYFRRVSLDEKAKVVFEKTHLKQASFLDTPLEQIHFRDVVWPRKGRRQILWDEYRGQPDYEKVAENYRQLVLNYEAKRDFDTAEDFHIGEMEMRRKKKRKPAEDKAAQANGRVKKMLWRSWGTWRELTNAYSIYKLLSNYGTSYVQGLLVLGGLLGLFSGIFLFTGLKPNPGHEAGFIDYDLCLDACCQYPPWRQWISDYAKAVLFTFSLLTFQKERLYEPANEWTLFWVCIAVLALAGQTALVLFALRRRFKR